mmetsp:Transcript_52271/g.167600  ORF Transcript_52271/g.167600 Transcript_52271/m.167600 type:complete len:440 (-) Transcript_52271:17-1336(-)
MAERRGEAAQRDDRRPLQHPGADVHRQDGQHLGRRLPEAAGLRPGGLQQGPAAGLRRQAPGEPRPRLRGAPAQRWRRRPAQRRRVPGRGVRRAPGRAHRRPELQQGRPRPAGTHQLRAERAAALQQLRGVHGRQAPEGGARPHGPAAGEPLAAGHVAPGSELGHHAPGPQPHGPPGDAEGGAFPAGGLLRVVARRRGPGRRGELLPRLLARVDPPRLGRELQPVRLCLQGLGLPAGGQDDQGPARHLREVLPRAHRRHALAGVPGRAQDRPRPARCLLEGLLALGQDGEAPEAPGPGEEGEGAGGPGRRSRKRGGSTGRPGWRPGLRPAPPLRQRYWNRGNALAPASRARCPAAGRRHLPPRGCGRRAAGRSRCAPSAGEGRLSLRSCSARLRLRRLPPAGMDFPRPRVLLRSWALGAPPHLANLDPWRAREVNDAIHR